MDRSFDFFFESFDFILDSFDFFLESFDFILESFDFIFESFDFFLESFDFGEKCEYGSDTSLRVADPNLENADTDQRERPLSLRNKKRESAKEKYNLASERERNYNYIRRMRERNN